MIRKILTAILVPPDRFIHWMTRGNFALKDVFTTVNLLCGVGSLVFAIHGNRAWASLMIMIGYLVGDVLDGPVARLTGRLNEFGSKLDTIADHTAQCIAPAMVVYLVYQPISAALALSLAGLLIAAGTIRHARGELVPFDFPLCWKGIPRPAGSFIILGFINSTLFIKMPGGIWVGVVIVVGVAVGSLLPIPFLTHHGRRLPGHVIAIILSAFVTCIAAAFFLPMFFWDVVFLWMFGYACTSWVPMTDDEQREYFGAVRDWRAKMRQAMAGGSDTVTEVSAPAAAQQRPGRAGAHEGKTL